MGKHRVRQGVGSFALILALVGLVICQSAEAQKTKGKSRLAETKYLMRCISQPNCAGVAGALKEKGPADDKAWDQVVAQASVLNEVSYLLMDDGRCPDKDWAGAAKELRESSAKLLDAAKAKNLEDAQAAFKGVTGSCGTCHKVHREKK
jgi:cytochrome c556